MYREPLNTTKLESEHMFCLAYFSVLMKCGFPILECLSLSKNFLVESEQWLLDEVEHSLLGGSPAPFHNAFSKIDTIEGRILKLKAQIGEEDGTLDERIYEALVIILLFRKLNAVDEHVDVLPEVRLLHKLLQDLAPEDRAAELGLARWPHGVWSDDAANPEIANDDVSLMKWLAASSKPGTADAGNRITKALTGDISGNAHVLSNYSDNDIDSLAERILLIVSHEHI